MQEAFNEKAVFLVALQLPPSDREEYLRSVCPDRSTLERLRAMLSRADNSEPQDGEAEAPRPLGEGSTLGDFTIIRAQGEGGMGVVYLAEEPALSRRVAIKVLKGPFDGGGVLSKFREEARRTAGLSHPGIVKVFRFGFDADRHYIVSEFVDGPTLRSVIDARRSASDPSETREMDAWRRHAAETVAAVADALDHCHRRGVIHRDVKPSNILVDPEAGPKLTDFGIARHTSDGARYDQTALIGSCHYMSPEQASAASQTLDRRTDIFSLGVVLYEMLLLRKPFDGKDSYGVLKSVIADPPPRPRSIDRRLPRPLEIVALKALEKNPIHRYQSAAHMAADLRSWLEGHPILARPAGVVRRARRWVARRQRPLLVAAVVVLVAATGGTWLSVRNSHLRSMGRLVVPPSLRGARVMVIPYDARLVPGVATDLGVAPLEATLNPGLYRVRLLLPDGRVREATSLLEPASTPRQQDMVEIGPGAGTAGTGMFRFEAGDYELGAPPADGRSGAAEPYWLEAPRRVVLAAFAISRTEVSNREYREFVLATGRSAPEFWPEPYDSALDELPVVDISWDDANAYCRWRGVRLPTPNEWEAAVRAPAGGVRPWTSSPGPLAARADMESASEAYAAFAAPVDSHPELGTPLGLLHPLSNVQEYTEGIAHDRQNGMVIKGRSWQNSVHRHAAQVYVLSGRGLRGMDRGFRVAVSLDLEGNDP